MVKRFREDEKIMGKYKRIILTIGCLLSAFCSGLMLVGVITQLESFFDGLSIKKFFWLVVYCVTISFFVGHCWKMYKTLKEGRP